MGQSRFLKITLPLIAVPALLILILPTSIWTSYVDILEPLCLLTGSFLALLVSFSYRKQLKAAFLFLSVFLLIYALAIVLFLSYSPILIPFLSSRLDEESVLSLIQAIQFTNYAMLFFFSINILKVVNVTQLNKKAWLVLGVTIPFCVFLAIYPVLPFMQQTWNQATPDISHIVIRALDAALIIVLSPVLWLYVQHLKSEQRQSLTFTVVILGIVFVTLFDYLFELVIQLFPHLLPGGSHLYSTIPEMLFVYGYLMIALGLYVHRKVDAWGYQAIEKAMSGKLDFTDIEEAEKGKE